MKKGQCKKHQHELDREHERKLMRNIPDNDWVKRKAKKRQNQMKKTREEKDEKRY